jgi:hypothetical protein
MNWTVYTAQFDEVHATVWTDKGPQPRRAVVKIMPSPTEAQREAERMQRSYDRVRRALPA